MMMRDVLGPETFDKGIKVSIKVFVFVFVLNIFIYTENFFRR